QPVTAQKNIDGREVIVEKVLVVDLIESEILYDPLHVEKLYDEYAVLVQCLAYGIRDGVQLLQVKEDAGSIDNVEFPVQLAGNLQIEELVYRWNARLVGEPRGGPGGFHSQDVVAQILEMTELRTVVRADVQHGRRCRAGAKP